MAHSEHKQIDYDTPQMQGKFLWTNVTFKCMAAEVHMMFIDVYNKMDHGNVQIPSQIFKKRSKNE